MIRMSEAVLRQFLADKTVFPEGHLLRTPNPGLEVDDDSATIHGGVILNGNPHVPSDLLEAFCWWRERREVETFSVTVPRDRIHAMKAALAGLGLEASSLDYL